MNRLKKLLAFIVCVSLLMNVCFMGNSAYAKETSSKDASSKATSSKETSSKDTSSKDASSKNTSSKETSSKDASSKNTSSKDASSDKTDSEENRNGVVAVQDSLNVRREASVKAKSLGTLANGDKVVIVGEDVIDSEGQKWYKISYNKGFGYVSADYVQVIYEYVYNEAFEEKLTKQKFPESYKVLLRQIHAAHPDWVFLADHLTMTFNEALEEESKVGKSLVQDKYTVDSQKSMEFGAYNWENNTYASYDSGGWVTAHKDTVAYYLEPRNFLNESNIFLFLDQSYNSKYQSKKGLNKILKGTFMDSEKGFPEDTYKTYSDVLIKAAEKSKVNPYILAAMILVEQGTGGTGGSISGKVSGYKGYYNYFNIGAYAQGGYTAVQRGLRYAMGLIGTKGTYDRPWNTRAKSIIGGAKYYGNNFVARGQNTLYYKKYNVIVPDFYINQYMTNVSGAVQEAANIKKAYTGAGVDSMPLVFSIPVYKDTSEKNTTSLSTSKGANNYFLESLSVKGYKISPTFDRYTKDYTLVVGEKTTKIKINATVPSGASVKGTGEVKLKGGKNTISLVVTAASGKTSTYTLTVHKDGNAEPEPEEDSSSSSSDSSDNSTSNSTSSDESSSNETSSKPTSSKPIEPEIKGDYNNGKNLTGVAPLTDVETFIKKLKVENGTVKVLDEKGKTKTTGTIVTGDKIQIKNSAGKVTLTKSIVIYGDINADGKISIIDLATVQKHLLEISVLKDAKLAAADVNKDGKVTIIDLAGVQKHLLEKTLIVQK